MRGEIKYCYCLDENNNLVHIRDIIQQEASRHRYTCLECGNEMHARIGKIKVPHFAHNPGVSCHGESYLHKLAKRKFKEHFESSGGLRVLQKHLVECTCEKVCDFYHPYFCHKENDRWHNLKEFYNTCEEEVSIKGFVADLLLSKSDKIEREPVLIEVLVTHACEESKINSGLKIIETMKIESESDIDNIINNGFIEGENCRLHNFKKLQRQKVETRPIERFILHASGGATTKQIPCKDINTRIENDSIAELNLNIDKLSEYQMFFGGKAYLFAGLLYLKKIGINVRNCLICKYYHEDSYSYSFLYKEPICGIYKKCGTPKNPKQTSAIQCHHFSILNDYLNKVEPSFYEAVSELKSLQRNSQ